MASSSEAAGAARTVLCLARELAATGGSMTAESVRLSRKVSLLIHLLEEIRDFAVRDDGRATPPGASTSSVVASPLLCLEELAVALEATKRFLLLSGTHSTGEIFTAVELVRVQLRRQKEKIGAVNLKAFEEIYNIFTFTHVKDLKRHHSFTLEAAQNDITSIIDCELREMVIALAEVNGKSNSEAERVTVLLMDRLNRTCHGDPTQNVKTGISSSCFGSCTVEEQKNESLVIPEDFRCPISLELMRDPVIVSTGQTYERSFIQRWIDCGNQTCPKTQQKLQNLTLTPNFVLRSLIMQWCEANRIEQPHRSANGRARSDGTFEEISGEKSLINGLVSKLSSRSTEELRSAAAEIRSLAKRSTDNRILIAEAGAIPALVSLLWTDDHKTQEHAVTSLLNLSIYDHNKEVIMLAGAIAPIIQVLRCGSMEARENAAAAIFSLSLVDENKITIGGTPGAIEALVELLESGSPRGKKDAATALFNLCIYQGNKPRAVRAGILRPLVKMLKDSTTIGMVDEILTVMSVLVSHQEGKAAISKANTIPLLIDLLRTGQPRNKENATAILLALCKKDNENLACMGRLGAVIPLTEVAKTGTERAKRKATTLLEHLQKLQVL
ncbi:hypothetical protein HPP92_023486 [Vanilla planifolia]|uniref:RING-type E3 ubiquitin transferase n=1 Tax=Vanilla planifolia TaxID=51239 RepID=A0A835PRK4_VANPL|nr:hypothetical protein HPP92_023486 [Vanilla planifolia]